MTSLSFLFANRVRSIAAGVVAACTVFLPGPLWGQATNWNLVGTSLSTTGTNVGIGTTNPSQLLDVNGIIHQGGGSSWLVGDNVDGAHPGIWMVRNVYYGYQNGLEASTGNTYLSMNGGKVGIGTTAPLYLLSVKGAIGATDVIVTGSVGADYVFNPGYRLRPLTEVASFIKEHHHLPEIPSAAEVQEKGINVGDMQAKLLAKIEELTLHMIQADLKNRGLQERIAQLEARAVSNAAIEHHAPRNNSQH